MNGRRRVWCQALALGCAGAGLPLPGRAHDLPPRRLIIERTPPRGLRLSYQLDAIEALHPLLARRATRAQFLDQFGGLGESDLERALLAARAALQLQTRLTAPGGRAAAVTAWEWPPTRAWQEPLQAAAFLLQAGVADPGHAAGVSVRAQVQVPPGAARLQISVPPALHPLLVVHGAADQFWLTDLLPTAMLDL